jgi:hypothetical protein
MIYAFLIGAAFGVCLWRIETLIKDRWHAIVQLLEQLSKGYGE